MSSEDSVDGSGDDAPSPAEGSVPGDSLVPGAGTKDAPDADDADRTEVFAYDPPQEVREEEDAVGLRVNEVVTNYFSGAVYGDVTFGDKHSHRKRSFDTESEKAVFKESLKHRDEFIGQFLKQALAQANATFRMSVAFMIAGGLIVLTAGVLALVSRGANPGASVSLVSGLGGVLVTVCGAAFSLKADRSRKHLSDQAERMHDQLLDERKFVQVAELLSGIKNDDVNDRARVSLALHLMRSDSTEVVHGSKGDRGDVSTKLTSNA